MRRSQPRYQPIPARTGAEQVIRHREVGQRRRPRQRGPDSLIGYNLNKIFDQNKMGATTTRCDDAVYGIIILEKVKPIRDFPLSRIDPAMWKRFRSLLRLEDVRQY